MKKILHSLLLLFLLPAAIHAQTQFWSDTFEDVGAPSSGSRTPSTTFNASNERYFDRVTTAQVNTTLALSGFEGSKFWGAADVDNLSGQNTQSPHQNVTWSSINISGRSGLSFKGLFATGTNNNFDHFPGSSTIDYMIVEYRIDGGPWTSLVRFFPNTANSGSAALALETTGDSLAQGEGAALDGTFTEFSANITGTGTLLDLRFKCESNGTSFEEEFADNFRLFEAPACVNPTITSQPPNRSICNGSNTTFNIAATGATAYQWQVNTGSGFNNVSNVAPYSGVTTATLSITGVTPAMSGYLYRCIASDASCNTTSSSGTLTVSNPVLSPNSQLNVSCFGGSNGSATVSPASGGISPYTYNWTPGNPTGDGTISVSGLTAGSWTCTVTDNIGCTATATFNITAPTAINVTAASQTNVSCNGGSNGAASINTPTGGAGGYTYNWTPGNPTGDGTTSVTGLTAGSWTCTVTDANSCTATATFNITAPSALMMTAASQTNVSCNGGSNGAASVNAASGGAGGYTYNWTPGNPTGDGTVSVTGLTAGSWTCTVTDANSCTASQTFNITAPTAITVTAASQTNVSCNGGSNGAATVNAASGGAGGYTYNWTPGNPTGDGTVSVTGLTAGSWTCTVTDANSCTASQTFNITAPTAISVTAASQTNVSCNGGSNGAASINTPTGGAGGYTYNWTPGNPTGDGTVSVTGLTAGSWTCTVTDANSCTATQTFNITAPTALVVTPVSQTNISCNGGSNGAASVSVSGGTTSYSYNWTPGNPTGDGTASVTGLTAGSWTCTVTDANSCTASATFNITAPTAISVTAASQTNVACNGGSNGAASINTPTGGAGGYTYNWTPGNPTGDGTVSVTGLTAGSWTCTVTDANSCTATQTFNITAPTAISVTAASQTNVSCNGGSNGAASINTPTGGAGGYTYNWTPGNPTGDGTVSVTGLTAGSWTCTVTDANSCTASQTFNITAPTALVVTPVSQTNISCNGGSNGAASVSVSGGTTSYSYNWTPGNPTGDGTASVTGLTAGTWTCTVTDANSCTATATFNITAPTALVVTPVSQTNISCNGGSNGAASVSVSGGTTAYSYNWTPGNPTGDGTASVTGLTAGTWTCTVTDANSCTATATFNITAPSALVMTASSQTNVSCNGGSNGTASVNAASGGAGGYTYNWTPGNPTGDGTVSVTGLTAGTWTCTVTDANSCTTTQTFSITAPTAISVTAASQTNVSCNGGSNGAASINTPTGGAGGYTYNWTPGNPTGDGTVAVTGLTAGSWTCTVTDANSCTASQTFNITAPTALVVTPVSQTNISCNGGSNGAASVSVSGGTTSYSYNWTPGNPTGDGTASVTGLTAGTWTCTVTDANSCTATATFNITAPTALVVTPVSQTNISCNGGSNGAASVTVSGGTTSYSYNWTPGNPTGDGTASVTGLTATTWTCTVTDANSCTSTATFNITAPTALVVTPVSQTNISCNGGSNGAASVSVSGGTTAYSYNWTPGNPTGDGTASVTGLTAGTWTCTVTDANSCTSTATFNITAPSALVMTVASQTNVSCNGGSNGAASVNAASGGAGGYTYNWTPGNPTGDGTTSVTGLTAGSWTCTVTDANSCTTTQTFNITAPTALVVTPVSQTNISCNGGSNGAASVTVSGGTTGYSYNWTPGNPTGDGTASVTGLTAGTWTCTVTDANSCTATATFNITAPTALVAAVASQTNVSCNGGSNGAASVSVSGGTTAYSYNWTPGNPTGDGTASVTGLAAGTWTCTVTDANSCTTTQTFSITEPTAITASISSTPTACSSNTGTATVSGVTGGTGSYSYNWTPGNPTGDGTASVSGLGIGTWTCTITDANGCTLTKTVSVTTPGAPAVSLASQTNILCFGGNNGAAAVNATGVATLTYDWTPGNPAGDGTNSVTGLTAGTWTCTVTDGNGCSSLQTVTITQPSPVIATLSGTNVSCNGDSTGSATVTASGGSGTLSYDWTPGNLSTTTITGLPADIYTCTVTDANGCTTSATVEITEPPALSVVNTSSDPSCFGGTNGTASVTVTGGVGSYSYSWAPGGQTTPAVTGLSDGMYLCDISDGNGCSLTDTIMITEPSQLTATAVSTDATCNGANNGTATVTVTGGTMNYSYSWSPSGGNAATATNLATGPFTCNITDANGCTTSASVTINEPTALAMVITQVDVNCAGSCNGSAASSVTGGTGPYTYNWVPGGQTTSGISNLCAGCYTLTVTDANGCTMTQSVCITEPTALAATTTQNNVSCFGGNNGDASVTVTGGTGSYTYSWAPSGGNAATATGLAAGCYTVTITDAGICSMTQTICITEPAFLDTMNVVQTDISCFGMNDGSVSIDATGGTTPYSYSWSSSANTTNVETNLAPGFVTFTITDNNSCTRSVSVSIFEPALLTATTTATDVTCNGSGNGTATVVPAGGTPAYSYSWSSGGNAATETNMGPGTATVTVTDMNGCTTTGTVIITEPSALTAVVSNSVNPSGCGSTDGMIDITVTGGTAGYSFLWSDNSTNEDITNIGAGAYSCTVTDTNGCTVSVSGSVSDPNAPVVTLDLPVDTACNSVPGVITLSGESPAGGTWSGTGVSGNTFDAFSNSLPSGMYTITYTYVDSSGCTGIATDTMWVDVCIGIASVNTNGNWNVYPNPTSGKFTIETASLEAGSLTVEVYAADGRIVRSENKTVAAGSSVESIDLGNEATGVYLVKIVNNDHIYTTKLIRQ